MTDPRIQAALAQALLEAGQPRALASKIGSWIEQVTNGNERVDDRDAAAQHLERLFEATRVAEADPADAE